MGISIYCLGKKAFVALEKLNEEFNSIIDLIIIGTDTNVQEDYSLQIKDVAIKKGFKFCYRNEIANKINVSIYHIALGWRWLIEVEPGQKLIVFHDSLLPKYRGFNPLVTQLINGDSVIGATCFWGTEEFDEGAIISQKPISIDYPIKVDEAISKIAFIYAELLEYVVSSIYSGKTIEGCAQNNSEATYSLWRDEDDYLIDWSKSATYIKRFVDAVGYPYGNAFFYFKNIKIRVLDVEIVDDVKIENRDAGKILILW
jgi:methionyl-tRNA formyltransferase